MSKTWIPSPYQNKCMETHLTNAMFHIHDLSCGCRDPLRHIIILLTENKIDSTIKEETKQKIRCLLTEDTEGTSGDADNQIAIYNGDLFGIDEGDLEELFKQDGDDDASG